MLGVKRVLLVSGNGATLYRFAGREPDPPLSFNADDAGVARFAEYLQLSGPEPIQIMVDVVEEDFRLDTVPHVFGRDKKAVLENKQSRLFRESRYAQSIFLGRQADGRRDDQYLFTSIIRPELLDPWLAPLERFKIPLVGIYSLPVVSGELRKLLPVESNDVLLVSLQSRGGLRQTYFEGGNLKVSRLASIPRIEPDRIASYVLQEVERVRRYLNSLRLLGRSGPLDVCVLVHGSLLEDLQRQANDTVTTRFSFLELEEVGRKLKAPGVTTGDLPYADRLFCYLLAKTNPPNFYGSAEETRYYALRRAGRAMTTFAWLALVGGIGWSGFEFAKAVDQQLEIGTLGKQADFYEDRYVKGKERLPKLPADGGEIRQAVEMVGQIGKFRETPLDLMVVLSHALDEFPDLMVSGFDWESGAKPEGLPVAEPVRRSSRRGRRRRRAVPENPNYFQAAKISGEIAPFDGNYRLALEKVNRFAEYLRESESVEMVSILRRPLEISSRERLVGVASSTSDVGKAEFEVRVILRTHGERPNVSG